MRMVMAAALCLWAQAADAGVCDHKPSAWVRETATATAVGGAAATSATGAAMLGSTSAGASAAGTVGIIGGTSGAIDTVGGVLLAPEVIVAAAVVAVGGGLYEGGCWLVQ